MVVMNRLDMELVLEKSPTQLEGLESESWAHKEWSCEKEERGVKGERERDTRKGG